MTSLSGFFFQNLSSRGRVGSIIRHKKEQMFPKNLRRLKSQLLQTNAGGQEQSQEPIQKFHNSARTQFETQNRKLEQNKKVQNPSVPKNYSVNKSS